MGLQGTKLISFLSAVSPSRTLQFHVKDEATNAIISPFNERLQLHLSRWDEGLVGGTPPDLRGALRGSAPGAVDTLLLHTSDQRIRRG